MSDRQELDTAGADVGKLHPDPLATPESGGSRGFDEVHLYDLLGDENVRAESLDGKEMKPVGEVMFVDTPAGTVYEVDILNASPDGKNWRRDPDTVIRLGRKGEINGNYPMGPSSLTADIARKMRTSLRDAVRGDIQPFGFSTEYADPATVSGYADFLVPRVVAAAEMVKENGGHVTLGEVETKLRSLKA